MNLSDLFPKSELHDAVMAGATAAVGALLDAGADINARDWQGHTPLMEAVSGLGKMLAPLRDGFQKLTEKADETPEPGDIKSAMDALAKFNPGEMMAKAFERPVKDRPAEEDDPAMARFLLERGADANAVNKQGSAALMLAAGGGRLNTVLTLLDWNANPEAQDERGRTALMAAAEEGRFEVVEFLLKCGADWNKRTVNGSTTLMMAAQSGRVDTARLLIAKGADANTVNGFGSAALALAAQHGRAEMIAYLQSIGAAVGILEAVALDDLETAKNLPLPDVRPARWGLSLIDWAVRTGRKDALKLLLERGAKLDSDEETGAKILNRATLRGDTEMLRLLFDAGASAQGPFLPTLEKPVHGGGLFHAIMRNDTATARLLIERGASVHGDGEKNSISPLTQAAMRGQIEMVNLLLDSGANVNGSESDMMPPLNFAITRNDADMTRLLLERGAEQKSSSGGMAAVMAKDKPEVAELLKAARANDWHVLAETGDAAGLLAQINAGADVNQTDAYNRTALQRAAQKGRLEAVQVLLDHGADANHAGTGGLTALIAAVGNGNTEIVRLLIQRGADIAATSFYGATALQNAALGGKTEIVSLLTEAGAKIGPVEAAALGELDTLRSLLYEKDADRTDASEITPLMGAAAGGHTDCIAFLLARGADIGAIDAQGRAPLHYAVTNNRLEAARLLLDSGADINQTGEDRAGTAFRKRFFSEKSDALPEAYEDLIERRSSPPLVSAVWNEDLTMARFLLDRGAEVNPPGGGTLDSPLRSAALMNRIEAVRLLLERGADVHARDNDGKTLLQETILLDGKPEIKELLKQAAAR